MEPKDQFDALMKLADFWLARRNTRYQAYLRISAGLWGIMSAGIIYLKARPPETLLVIILVAVVIGHYLIVRQMQIRNSQDMSSTFFYVRHAEEIASQPGSIVKPTSATQPSFAHRFTIHLRGNFWGPTYWVLPTVFLALAGYLLIGVSK